MKRPLHLVALVSLMLLAGCVPPEDEGEESPLEPDMSAEDQGSSPEPDARPSLEDMKMGAPDHGQEHDQGDTPGTDMPAPDQGPDLPTPGEERVELDLSPWTQDVGAGLARVARVRASGLLEGPVALGREGDYVLENERGRYLIEGPDRVMSPCPEGGNLLDAAWRSPDGVEVEDNLGEVCLLVNVGQTMLPRHYEVLSQGGDGEAAVLAVTGPLTLLDFLNFDAVIDEYLPASIRLPLDLSEVLPVTVTVYYILPPGGAPLRVVTALRNDGLKTVHLATGHLMAGGGVGGYFNPLGARGGFGYESFGGGNLDGFPLPFMAYRGPQTSWAYVPEPDPRLEGDMPLGGAHMTVAGATASLLGRESLVRTLLTSRAGLEKMPGLLHLETGQVGSISHSMHVGDGALATMLDAVYPEIGVVTGTVHGSVTDQEGAPVEGARVTALDAQGRGLTQAITGPQGTYSMRAPIGPVTMTARAPGRPPLQTVDLELAEDEDARADLTVEDSATLEVTITDPSGAPVPGRLSVICEGPCPGRASSAERDMTSDSLPGGFAAVVPAGVDGVARVELPPGDYRLAVSRGMEWSLWPAGAAATGGELVELAGGSATTLRAEIAHVVRTPGVVSGDFHIHSVPSTDSTVALRARVLDYLTEGVDVMVSTDHDAITDFAPAILELGAQDHIASVIGDEITTSDTGHINGFPLDQDADHRKGGALDWGGGGGPSLMPDEIYAWIESFPGVQVIQINHPTGLGTIGALEVDVLRGISLADPGPKRLPAPAPDPDSRDTGLWSESFTAMEALNGHSQSRFWAIARWWMTMVGRGFSPTATAVTDTHRLYSDLGGAPRSFVFVGEGFDELSMLDEDAFAQAINDGRLVGSNGPFFTARLVERGAEAEAGLGEVLAAPDGQVDLVVDLEMPEWVEVDTVDVYFNREDVITAPGEAVEEFLAPDVSAPVSLDPDLDLEVAEAGEREHRRWSKQVRVELPELERDAYVIVIVRAAAPEARSMWPVVPKRNVTPFAFANPIYVDVDGGGWDDFPLAALAAEPPPPAGPGAGPAPLRMPHVTPPAGGHHHHGIGHHHHHHPHPHTGTGRLPTRAEIGRAVEAAQCDH